LGVVTVIGCQAVLNMAAHLSLVPIKAPLMPFVSYGGTDQCVMLTGTGLLLSIARGGTDHDRPWEI
jgi:cell division protein FtsW (lipid II flippase)